MNFQYGFFKSNESINYFSIFLVSFFLSFFLFEPVIHVLVFRFFEYKYKHFNKTKKRKKSIMSCIFVLYFMWRYNWYNTTQEPFFLQISKWVVNGIFYLSKLCLIISSEIEKIVRDWFVMTIFFFGRSSDLQNLCGKSFESFLLLFFFNQLCLYKYDLYFFCPKVFFFFFFNLYIK